MPRACVSASLPTPCSAPASRPRSARSPAATSAGRCSRRRAAVAGSRDLPPEPGVPLRARRRAAASTWVRTTCRRSSTSSVRSRPSPPSGSRGRSRARSRSARRRARSSPSRSRRRSRCSLQFEQGGQAQSLYSTDSPLLRQGVVEITGTEGTIVIPDPNTFGGALAITRPLDPGHRSRRRRSCRTRRTCPQEGVARRSRPRRARHGARRSARVVRTSRPGRFGYHVLDTLLSIEESVERGSSCRSRARSSAIGPLPVDFDPFARTL